MGNSMSETRREDTQLDQPEMGQPNGVDHAATSDIATVAPAPAPPDRNDPESIRRLFETGEYPYKHKMRRNTYEANKAELQVELLKVQRWVEETGERIVLLFEGRDAAGKGGTIKRYMEHMNPRTARVVALSKPTERERTQWYYQRYIEHLPAAGEIVMFDRSW
jgi:polyphosphate kinase 2 (PPK2 family)